MPVQRVYSVKACMTRCSTSAVWQGLFVTFQVTCPSFLLKIAKNSTGNLDIFAFTLWRGVHMANVRLQNNLQLNLQEISLHECAQKYTFSSLLVDSSPPWSCSRFRCLLLGICSVSQLICRGWALESWALAGGSAVLTSPACWADDLGCRSEMMCRGWGGCKSGQEGSVHVLPKEILLCRCCRGLRMNGQGKYIW